MIQRFVPFRIQRAAAALGLRPHAADVAAEVGLRETEAADRAAARELRQPALLLLGRAVGVDRIHHETALHRREGAQAGVAALELLHHQAVGDVVHARAAVAVEVRAEQAEIGELGDERHRERAVLADVLLDARQELLRDELAHGLARELLLVGEQVVEAEEVDAGEIRQGSLRKPGARARKA